MSTTLFCFFKIRKHPTLALNVITNMRNNGTKITSENDPNAGTHAEQHSRKISQFLRTFRP
jgi:hypothetical protein